MLRAIQLSQISVRALNVGRFIRNQQRRSNFTSPRKRGEGKSTHPEKIPLADLDAVVAQDAVGGGGMEVEIREGKMADELLAFQGHALIRACGKLDVAAVRAVELRGLETVHILDGLRPPLLQLGKGFFGVGRRRYFAVRHARATFRCEIRRELNLLAERQHVRK